MNDDSFLSANAGPVEPGPVEPATVESAPVPPRPLPPVPELAPLPDQRVSGPSGWHQFLVGTLVGALAGGAAAAGVVVATRDDNGQSGRTVVVGAASRPVRDSSVIGSAKDIQTVLRKVDGAVVAVQTGSRVDEGLFPDESSRQGGEGTGFVISSDGVIVTNDHVVEGSGGQIEVVFEDGTKEVAELLGRAPDYDLAVLKVNGRDLPSLELGSSDALQVGDEVVAVGNALALDGGLSVTKGIVSGKGRIVPETETGAVLYDMLQTDAAINPGNSGGPLVNAAGQVIGINTALAGGSQNVGFAISIDSAKSVIRQLRSGAEVEVAFLGVETSAVTPALERSLELSSPTGAVIRNVTKGLAADNAGLKENDVIVAIEGNDVDDPQDVGAQVRRFTPGDTIEVTIAREGGRQTVTVKLGARPNSLG